MGGLELRAENIYVSYPLISYRLALIQSLVLTKKAVKMKATENNKSISPKFLDLVTAFLFFAKSINENNFRPKKVNNY